MSVVHALDPVDQVCARIEIIGRKSLALQCARGHLNPFDTPACAAIRDCTHDDLPLYDHTAPRQSPPPTLRATVLCLNRQAQCTAGVSGRESSNYLNSCRY